MSSGGERVPATPTGMDYTHLQSNNWSPNLLAAGEQRLRLSAGYSYYLHTNELDAAWRLSVEPECGEKSFITDYISESVRQESVVNLVNCPLT